MQRGFAMEDQIERVDAVDSSEEDISGSLGHWEGEIERDDTEIETINKSVVAGDWIIRAMERLSDGDWNEYSIKKNEFPKRYNTEPIGIPDDEIVKDDGFMIYEVKPDDRTGIEISEAFGKVLADNFSDNFPVPQLEFRSWLAENAPKVTVRKQSRVYAKLAEDGDEITTRVEKGGAEILSFEAPWGGSMPVKIRDVLIINEDEVYRVGRAEFDKTYRSIDGEQND
jgi:hypothetical protein